MHNTIDYIHLNPVRCGLVTKPEEWRWSSAQWYAGIADPVIQIDATIPWKYDHAYRRRLWDVPHTGADALLLGYHAHRRRLWVAPHKC